MPADDDSASAAGTRRYVPPNSVRRKAAKKAKKKPSSAARPPGDFDALIPSRLFDEPSETDGERPGPTTPKPRPAEPSRRGNTAPKAKKAKTSRDRGAPESTARSSTTGAIATREPDPGPASDEETDRLVDGEPSDVGAADARPEPELPIIPAVAVTAGLIAILQGEAPTGGEVVDVIWTFIAIAAVTFIASRASRAAVLLAAAVAFVFIGLAPWLAVAGVALLGAVFLWTRESTVDPPFVPVLQSAIVGASALVALQFPGLGFTGSASILAAIALLPAFVTGLREAEPRVGRITRRAIVAGAVVAVVGCVLAGAAALSGRAAAEAGVQRANDGLNAIRAGDQDGATALLEEAGDHFRDAAGAFGSWWSTPSRLVPVVAQNARALEVAARQGSALTDAAVTAATTADVEQIRGSEGQIDLELVERVGTELRSTVLTLNGALTDLRRVRTPWLISPIGSRMTEAELDLLEASGDVDLAFEAATVLPGILGANEPRTYLVIFTNPAESREFGGFGGAYGLLRAVDGKLELLESGRGGELDPPAHEVIPKPGFDDPDSWPHFYLGYGALGIANYFGNLTGTIDFPTIARAAREVLPKKGQPEIDGVMLMDAFALEGLMELLDRPVELPDGTVLTADNVAGYLMRDQYLADATVDERSDLLGEIANQAFEGLLRIDTPGPERLGEVLGPAARQKRLQFTTFDPTENLFLEHIFLRSSIPAVPATTDYLAVVTDTAAPNKLDAYLERTIDYRVEINPATGRFDAEVDIHLFNNAPQGLPAYVRGFDGYYFDLEPGVQRERVSVFSSQDVFGEVFHDGIVNANNQFSQEFGLNRRLTFIDIPNGEERTVTMQVTGASEVGEYQVLLGVQPRALLDTVRIEVTAADGWVETTTGESVFRLELQPEEDVTLRLLFEER